MSDSKGFFRSVSDTPPEIIVIALAFAAGIAAAFIGAVAYPFVTLVSPGEIVIEDCGGDLTVWRHPRDGGLRWDGLCRTETYHTGIGAYVKEPMPSAGVDVTMRATVRARLPSDDAEMKALHRAYGYERAFMESAVMPAVMEDIRAAVADPGWHEAKGNIVERKLKGALEYGIRRVSPTGAVWSSHETKRALTEDIRRRLADRTFPSGVRVEVELGFVTER